ncbi:Dihydropteroate synthase [Mycena metata]|uniref:2-amino-4-hydroxy-6-hydroxymethyldihydropteridine diphosphokinase n=1 Tax=Mycena metata TaxID=1033252 RepID=A0AAD7NE37_9AGAR|nr:Dihydropteroate synthase [Mycena metata]
MSSLPRRDSICINDLVLTVPLLSGAVWPKALGQAALQPVLISLSIPHDISLTASSDDLSHSINYSLLCLRLRDSLNDKTAPLETLEDLSVRIFDILLLQSSSDAPLVSEAHLKVTQTRAPLNCKAVGVESKATSLPGNSWAADYVKHFCENLECSTIIGINPCEREELANCSSKHFHRAITPSLNFPLISIFSPKKIGKSSYQTLEALASYIAEETLNYLWNANPDPFLRAPFVSVGAAKPSAIVFASSSEIQIRRTYSDYPASFTRQFKSEHAHADRATHSVALALGSNLGDRLFNIELALRLLEAPPAVLGLGEDAVHVVDTSFMYESTPMYVTDQPSFINCACMIETSLMPLELLKLLKTIEITVGRLPSVRNGPRAVDLDIVFCAGAVIDTRESPRTELDDLEGELVIPHPRLAEREFVLKPLNDMIPDFIHPVLHQTVSALLAAVETGSMYKVIPFPQCPLPTNYVFPHTSVDVVPPTLTHWIYPSIHQPANARRTTSRAPRETRVMATLNTTPDSFSDVSPEEEISRVEPAIAAIRAAHPQLPISIDTFRPDVARAALSAGANCINDTGDAAEGALKWMTEMKKAAREFAVPVVLMHSRGDAGSNKDYSAYGYADPGQTVSEGVRIELGRKVDLIVKGRGGVRRWLVIVDPGVGFSKTLDGNLEVLRDAAAITADVSPRNPLAGYPQLIGASRKSFLGSPCAVQQGALVVRVHDLHEMIDVVHVANALW